MSCLQSKEGTLVAPWVVAQDECGTISCDEDPSTPRKAVETSLLAAPYPRRAVLRDANLGDVETLTQEQIEEAIGAATTKLPGVSHCPRPVKNTGEQPGTDEQYRTTTLRLVR